MKQLGICRFDRRHDAPAKPCHDKRSQFAPSDRFAEFAIIDDWNASAAVAESCCNGSFADLGLAARHDGDIDIVDPPPAFSQRSYDRCPERRRRARTGQRDQSFGPEVVVERPLETQNIVPRVGEIDEMSTSGCHSERRRIVQSLKRPRTIYDQRRACLPQGGFHAYWRVQFDRRQNRPGVGQRRDVFDEMFGSFS